MEQQEAIVLKNEKIAKDTYEMILQPEKMVAMSPGQFVNIQVDGFLLRRPFGLCEIGENTFTILYKVVGDGTRKLATFPTQTRLNVLLPLGSAFPILEAKKEILILGGGIGVPPLYEVAKQYRMQGTSVDVILGFNDKEYIIYDEKFKQLGCRVFIATMDGSAGTKGTVIDAFKEHQLTTSFVYSCGAMGMLKAVEENFKEGYLSFESRMACGMGACMGCVCKDKKDTEIYYRICKEGPVFEIGKVAF